MFIFSILLSVHLLWCWQGEFVKQSRVPLVADHFLYSHDISVRFSGDIVRNNTALRVFSDTSQMTSKCSKEKKTVKTKRRRVGHWCSHAFILPTSLGFKKKKCTFDEFRDSICRYSMFAVPSPTDQTTHPSLFSTLPWFTKQNKEPDFCSQVSRRCISAAKRGGARWLPTE